MPVKILLGVLAFVFLIAGGFAAKTMHEQNQMSPLPTGEVIPGVYSVSNGFVNLYLIRGDDGYLMIDAGNSAEQTSAAFDELGVSPDEVRAVLLTHSDGDHVSALPLFPDARVYLPEQEVQLIDGTTARSPMGGNSLASAYRTLRDRETTTLSGLSVQCILTPGHTPGSTCFLIDGRYLFTGDSMSLKDGRAALFNSFYNMDDDAQRASLRMLAAAVAPEYIFTGHYGYTDDPAALEGWTQ